MTTDPQILETNARCISKCIPPGDLLPVLISLADQIANGAPPVCGALSGDAPPTGSVTPQFIGQLYNQNNGEAFFYSTGLTSADWTAISGGECPITFEPDLSTLEGGTLPDLTYATSYTINFITTLTDTLVFPVSSNGYTISFPNLTTVSTNFDCSGNTVMTSLGLAALSSIDGQFIADSSTALISIDLSSLVSVSLDFTAIGCSSLTTLLVPIWLPTDGTNISLSGCALDAATVNLILARCVAAGVTTCTIDLSGGTNSPPTGQGILDAAALVLAGNTVTTN